MFAALGAHMIHTFASHVCQCSLSGASQLVNIVLQFLFVTVALIVRLKFDTHEFGFYFSVSVRTVLGNTNGELGIAVILKATLNLKMKVLFCNKCIVYPLQKNHCTVVDCYLATVVFILYYGNESKVMQGNKLFIGQMQSK
jgi:hypothetical protein